MKITDFKITNKVKEIKEEKFCSSCFKENPETEQGYSLCCHEDVLNKKDILKFTKRRDILNKLKEKEEVSEHGNLYCRDEAIFKFQDRLVYINVSKKEEIIIEELSCKI